MSNHAVGRNEPFHHLDPGASERVGPNQWDGMRPGVRDRLLEFNRSCRVLAGVLQCILDEIIEEPRPGQLTSSLHVVPREPEV